MRVFNTGDIFRGTSNGDMINQAIGTAYADKIPRSSVDLGQFGTYGVIAWFVFMDGTPHGYEDGWVWENRLSLDGKIVNEINISKDNTRLKEHINHNGLKPFRLAFQKDPYETGDTHCCKFVGAFKLSGFYNRDLTAFKYERISDSFKLGNKGEYGAILDSVDMFINSDKRFITPIENLRFSNKVLTMLKNVGVKHFWELLPIGAEANGAIFNEIIYKMYEYFKVEE